MPHAGSIEGGEHDDLPDYPRTEAELSQWIASGVEESSMLDYKQAAALKAETGEIAKDVSAFANSAGGVIIYGVAEYPKDSPKKHLPEKIDPVDGASVTKEWLEHKISGGIQPKLSEIFIHPIRLTNSATGVVYVVVVPKGKTAHQALSLKRYYRRYNFESVAMEDHEIRDIMHRVTHPQVKLNFELSVGPEKREFGPETLREYRWLHVSVHNIGAKQANHVFADLYLPTEVMANPAGYRYFENRTGVYAIVSLDMSIRPASGLLVMQPNTDPLLPGMDRHIKTIQLSEAVLPLPAAPLAYDLHADEAPSFREKIELKNLPQRQKTGVPLIFVSNRLPD